MVAILFVSVSLGLSNFAAAISAGLSGVTSRQRVEIGLAFGVFEAGMPVVGLALGHQFAHALGQGSRWFGGAILIAAGGYAVFQTRRSTGSVRGVVGHRRGRLGLTALALSVDNLAIGFALGTRHLSLVLAAVVIGGVSVGMSLVGLELGSRLGTRFGEQGELLGGLLLIGVGIAIAVGGV